MKIVCNILWSGIAGSTLRMTTYTVEAALAVIRTRGYSYSRLFALAVILRKMCEFRADRIRANFTRDYLLSKPDTCGTR